MTIESEPAILLPSPPRGGAGREVGSAAPAAEAATPAHLRVPALVRRTSRLLMVSGAFVGTGQQMVPTLGAIMAVHLTGSPALAGLGSSVLGLTRALSSYPSGRLADARGRRPLLLAGLLLALGGSVGLGSSMLLGRFPVFLAALFIYGIGSGVSEQQRRLSAVDIYPPELRAKGLGFVVTGSLIGAAGGPLLISAAGFLSHARGIDQVSMAWFLVPLLLIPSLGLVLLIRPDPREIAVSLAHYYPGYRGAERGPASMAPTKSVTLMTFLRHYPQLVAFVCMFVLYANMSMMMALTPMTMSSIGLPLAAISITVAVHVLGMYGLSLPIGAIADSLGRRRVLFAGLGLSTAGTVLVALTVVYPLMMLGLFLIGVGWSCGNISTAALVADTTPPTIRGQAMGANASFSAAASVVAPLLGGVLVQFFGTASLVAFTLIIVMPTLALLIRLQETQPGIFAHERVW